MDETIRTVAMAMLTTPVRHPLGTTVGEIRDFFGDDHVHAALIVGPGDYLAAVVERDDIAHCRDVRAAAVALGRLAGRTVLEGARLRATERAMHSSGRRRAAVVQEDGKLIGLLCLKASWVGFCSEDDVRARALDQGRNAVLSSADTD